MTRFGPGDRIEHAGLRGEVIDAHLCGWTGQIVALQFHDGSTRWIMANELTLIGIAHAAWIPRIVGGTDMEAMT